MCPCSDADKGQFDCILLNATRASSQVIIPLTWPLWGHTWNTVSGWIPQYKSNPNKLGIEWRRATEATKAHNLQGKAKGTGNCRRKESEGSEWTPIVFRCPKEPGAGRDRHFSEACGECSGSNGHKSQQGKFQLSTREQRVQEHDKHCNSAPERQGNLHPCKTKI